MRNIWVIAQKEYKQYFISPIAYAVAFLVLVILGVIFYANVVASLTQGLGQYVPTIQIVISPMTTIFLFMLPAVTMRSIADESKNGTLELMLTAPVRDSELVIGKWLGAFLFVLTLVFVTWIYPLILNLIVKPGIDQGLMAAGYLGIILLVGALLAIGILISSFFTNQIAAFFATLGVFLLFWMISYPAQAAGNTGGELLRYLDMSEHFYNSFIRGIVDLKDVVFYLSVTVLALFLGSVSVETRRWR